MIKFKTLVENLENLKYYKITSHVEMIVEAKSEGEAAYLADENLSALKNQSLFDIKSIEESSGKDFNPLSENINIKNKL